MVRLVAIKYETRDGTTITEKDIIANQINDYVLFEEEQEEIKTNDLSSTVEEDGFDYLSFNIAEFFEHTASVSNFIDCECEENFAMFNEGLISLILGYSDPCLMRKVCRTFDDWYKRPKHSPCNELHLSLNSHKSADVTYKVPVFPTRSTRVGRQHVDDRSDLFGSFVKYDVGALHLSHGSGYSQPYAVCPTALEVEALFPRSWANHITKIDIALSLKWSTADYNKMWNGFMAVLENFDSIDDLNVTIKWETPEIHHPEESVLKLIHTMSSVKSFCHPNRQNGDSVLAAIAEKSNATGVGISQVQLPYMVISEESLTNFIQRAQFEQSSYILIASVGDFDEVLRAIKEVADPLPIVVTDRRFCGEFDGLYRYPPGSMPPQYMSVQFYLNGVRLNLELSHYDQLPVEPL